MKNKYFYFILIFSLVALGSYAQSHKPLQGIKILLDPGHGGADPGAVGPSGLKESDINLRVARYLRDLLISDGASVYLTRDTDKYLSLAQRVDLSHQLRPDLFLSIHHNASLTQVKQNKSEIYYNAFDYGLAKVLAEDISRKMLLHGFGKDSKVIPGGFYILRNNPATAVLTEASYISIPSIEKKLQTGRELTNQAHALWKSIREVFTDNYLDINLFASDKPLHVDTPFMNLIFTSEKQISKVRARLTPSTDISFNFSLIPSFQNTYKIYNDSPFKSGDYQLQLTFHSSDGSVSNKHTVPLHVDLPVEYVCIESVAPFIPEGFKGAFPLLVTLKDRYGHLNPRARQLSLSYEGSSEGVTITSTAKVTMIPLILNGSERDSIDLTLLIDNNLVVNKNIQIKSPQKTFILGKIVDHTNQAVSGVKIIYGNDMQIVTTEGGFFFLEYSKYFGNMQLDLIPPLGYARKTAWIKTKGEPVLLPTIQIEPRHKNLLNKNIAIMAPISFDNVLRPFVRNLMNAGATVTRLNLPPQRLNSEHQAVLEANLIDNLDLLLSFKYENQDLLQIKHYHAGGRGKLFASKLANKINSTLRTSIYAKALASSDYEINHSQATALVFSLPSSIANTESKCILDMIFEVFCTELE